MKTSDNYTDITVSRASFAAPGLQTHADILYADKPLDLFIQDLRQRGFVGDPRHAKLLFLAHYTRFGEQPVSVIVKGPSSGGKSYLVESVCRFFPDDAFFNVHGMTSKSLRYLGDSISLSHKHIILGEWAGLEGKDGNADLRQLISAGKLEISSVMNVDGKLETHRLTIPGPTGLIATTTQTRLFHEDETRALSITVGDTPERVREVCMAQAHAYNTHESEKVSVERWHEFHRFVEREPHTVAIPYAAALATLIDASATRISRDFRQLLELITASTLVHQHQRDRDLGGRLVASQSDYAVVFEVL